MPRTVLVVAASLVALAGSARAEAPVPPAPPAKPAARPAAPSGEVLARGEGFTITADQFRARLAELPPDARATFSTPEKRKELLENLVRFELLAAEGRRLGLDRDPDVVFATNKLVVAKLVKDRFGGLEKAEKEKAFDHYVGALQSRSAVVVNGAALRSLQLDGGAGGAKAPAGGSAPAAPR